jgi:hypothetical protein
MIFFEYCPEQADQLSSFIAQGGTNAINTKADAMRCDLLRRQGFCLRGLNNKIRWGGQRGDGVNEHLKANINSVRSLRAAFDANDLDDDSYSMVIFDHAFMPPVS